MSPTSAAARRRAAEGADGAGAALPGAALEAQPAGQVPPAAPTVRIAHATRDQVAGICSVVNACALEGTTLPITADEVAMGLGQFIVAERSGQIMSCGALVVFSPSIAEIRSIAVSPAARGTGLGAAIVRRLIDEANSLELDELVLLTKVPDFFGRLGFIPTPPEELPEEFLTIQIHSRGRSLNGRTAMRLSLM